MSYTEFCPTAGDICPGGPDECLLNPQPIDPELCPALAAEKEEEENEGEPPGGPGG